MISTISMAAACANARTMIPKGSRQWLVIEHLRDAERFLSELHELTPELAIEQLRWCKENHDLIKAAMALQDSARAHAGVAAVEAGQ